MNVTIELDGEIEEWAKNADSGSFISLGKVSILKMHDKFIMLDYDLQEEVDDLMKVSLSNNPWSELGWMGTKE